MTWDSGENKRQKSNTEGRRTCNFIQGDHIDKGDVGSRKVREPVKGTPGKSSQAAVTVGTKALRQRHSRQADRVARQPEPGHRKGKSER